MMNNVRATVCLAVVAFLCLYSSATCAKYNILPQEQVNRKQAEIKEPDSQAAASNAVKLKSIKISGYIQGRYESYQQPEGLNNIGDNRTLDNRFYLRRARFKITGQLADKSIGVVQWDIAGYDRSKGESKDVYLEYHPWGAGGTGPFFVRFGQMNWPFGYVIERSSSAREVPERPKVFAGITVSLSGYPSFNGLFPGERDKGVALFSAKGGKLDWAFGLFNGTGTKAGDTGKAFLESGGRFEDNNAAKTIVGRVRYPVTKILNAGASIFNGSQAVRVTSDTATIKNVKQTGLGVDLQYYFNGGSIQGEYVTGKEPFFSNANTIPDGKAGTNRTVRGWYLVGVKSFSGLYQGVVQYDVLDDEALLSFGKLSTWNLGVIRLLDDATRIKLFYEINKEEKSNINNNGLRLDVITVF